MLHNKIALVARAHDGVGELVARRYAAEGAHVIMAGSDIKGLERVYDLINDSGGKATIAAVDPNNITAVSELAKQLQSQFKKIDVLVGMDFMAGELKPLVDYSVETWDNILFTNVTANWYLIRHLEPLLKVSDCPRMIFITSEIVSRKENFFYGPYAASKAALESIIRTYANENKRSGLKANLVEMAMCTDRPEHDLGDDVESDSGVSRVFVMLASEVCQLTGRTHLAHY